MKHLIAFAALAAILPLVPANAEPAPRSQTVAYADLDLSTAKGRATFDRRVHRAAADVCGEASDYDLAGQNDLRHCRTATANAAFAQAEAQWNKARLVQVATAGR